MAATTAVTDATSTHGAQGHPEEPFGERYDRSLKNPRLSANITRYQQNWRVSRGAAIHEIEFEELRAKLKAAKTDVVERIDDYIEQFTAAAVKAGATVHLAQDAEQARRVIHEICVAHNATKISKSKSMVSEEIELNHYLEARGIECIETDLGEWIVQKAGQRPSHIVGPALHMGRQDVGELLNKLGHPVSHDDIPEQVHTIRDLIRPGIMESTVGMTGGNALIAETGTVMICTNEGNGRLVSSVPPVQIALVGIEKLIPTWDDAVTQLRLLGRSGTGQRITVYTTFITGPTPGPRDAHRAGRQRPPENAGDAGVRRGAALHPLRRLRERLPALPRGRRSRLRPHLHRRDRAGRDAVPPRAGRDRETADDVPLLQRLRDRLPGRDSAAAPDPRRAQDGRARAKGCRRSSASSWPVIRGRACSTSRPESGSARSTRSPAAASSCAGGNCRS